MTKIQQAQKRRELLKTVHKQEQSLDVKHWKHAMLTQTTHAKQYA